MWRWFPSSFRPDAKALGNFLLALAGFVFLLIVSRILPGHAPNALYLINDASFSECLLKGRETGLGGCPNFGFPAGAPQTFGLPLSLIASRFGTDSIVSLSTILFFYGTFILAAYVGAILLFRKVTGIWWLSVVGAVLYLGSVVVNKFVGYGALGLGINLIPLYLLVDLQFLESLSRQSKWKVALWLGVVVAGRCFAIFMDGYSFLFSCALSLGCLLVIPVLQKKFSAAAIACGSYIVACAVAASLYQAYFPSEALGATPLDGFRAQGVDTFGLISPQPDSIYHRWFGIGGPIDPLVTYSDGSSSSGIFLGYAWIAAGLLLAVLLFRRRIRITAWHLAIPILLAGLVSLVLSLGPSLKFHSFREAPAAAITAQHYRMPEDAAVMSLPTAWLYKLPGIKTARALVRWLVLVQLALSVLIVLGILVLRQEKKPLLALSLMAWALLELVPDYRSILESGRFAYARAYTLNYDYIKPLQRQTQPSERTLFLELQERPGGNQYVVNILCTRASLLCYNTGGDKNTIFTQQHWPIEIVDARYSNHLEIAVRRIIQNNLVDVFVVPFFDLKLSAYSEAQGAVDVAKVVESARALARETDLDIVIDERYAFLRPRAAAREVKTDACSISCWRSWPNLELAKQPNWGPKKVQPQQPFNRQADGRSLLWVQIDDPDRVYSLALGEALLASRSDGRAMTAHVPDTTIKAFVPGARYPLYLLDTVQEKKLLLGYLTVARFAGS